MTFGEYWPVYLEKKRGFIKDTSLNAYALSWTTHLAAYFNDIDMETVRNSHLQKYVDEKIKDGHSVHSVKDHIVVLKNMLRLYSIDQDRPIVAFQITWPSESLRNSKPREAYTDKELEKLIEHCKGSALHFDKIVALLALTGARIGEVCGIRFEDIDYDDSTVFIRRTVGRTYWPDGTTQLFVNPPKSRASERRIPIPSWLNQYFKKYQKLYGLPGDAYISKCSEISTPFLEPRTFRTRFASLCKKLGIQYKSVHSLRHTYASRLIKSKVDIRTTAELLGHSDVQTTLNTYAHSDDATKRAAAKKIFI